MIGINSSFSSTHIVAANCAPRYHCAGVGDDHLVALSPRSDRDDLYLNGTLDELAAFVLQLADIVRELNARELAAV